MNLEFESRINKLRLETEHHNKQLEQLKHIAKTYENGVIKYRDLVYTQRLLVTLSDKRFQEILNYISEIINKALLAMFPDDNYRFDISRKLFQGKSVHLNVMIEEFIRKTGRYESLSVRRGIGNGQAQVISYLFTLCMYKVSNKRPIIILDEILTGFHEVALEYVIQITKVFAEEGFQFICVEYSFENFGTPVVVRKDGTTNNSTITESSWDEVSEMYALIKDNNGSQLFKEDEYTKGSSQDFKDEELGAFQI